MDPQDAATHFSPRLKLELSQLEKASGDTVEARKPVELDQQSVGRLSRMDAMQNQAMASAVDVRRHARIGAIHAALARIDTGEFGTCEDCGDPIPVKRLELDPTFTRCVGCRG
ncbi:TraR/DksA family transcriptional regulator (plasmid) [Paracoccus liaowanqingii]|uniref:TraR/DksA family transcriptional regulator n=1 Tax=Paracoccus liaowanqingii TaxID=2560053 RepID=A0A4Y5SS38_9RHOB|nr:TraR/DksA family transcriptional regulator [Paracoccus liaowanqingii]QDA36297.1 TraR/DksA family transcriptional regulator [Paracoccus liaowanqingii]